MTKVKLTNGVIINALEVELEKGILKISTTENTVEELAELFADKANTNLIIFMTEKDIESGNRIGFTSFIGISYKPDGVKTVELTQPADVTETRISNAEGSINLVNEEVLELESTVNALLGEETEVVENE